MFQLYLPSAIVVILSWLTLYIKMENDNQVLSSPVININRVLEFRPMFLCRVPRFEKMNEGFSKIISKIFTDSKLLHKTSFKTLNSVVN